MGFNQGTSNPLPQFKERRGFYQDVMNYRDTPAVSLTSDNIAAFLDCYGKVKNSLGYACYTEVSRSLRVEPQAVMRHVKYLHIHSLEWEVRFSNNRNNENVYFKLIPKDRSAGRPSQTKASDPSGYRVED
ncbi:MAG: hypothetical protein AB1898_04395 [Acidobacteriota bacterium]